MVRALDESVRTKAGPVGCDLANGLADKCIEAVVGFPSSTVQQQASILALVAHRLALMAEDMLTGPEARRG